jgi:hypothetical protein
VDFKLKKVLDQKKLQTYTLAAWLVNRLGESKKKTLDQAQPVDKALTTNEFDNDRSQETNHR